MILQFQVHKVLPINCCAICQKKNDNNKNNFYYNCFHCVIKKFFYWLVVVGSAQAQARMWMRAAAAASCAGAGAAAAFPCMFCVSHCWPMQQLSSSLHKNFCTPTQRRSSHTVAALFGGCMCSLSTRDVSTV